MDPGNSLVVQWVKDTVVQVRSLAQDAAKINKLIKFGGKEEGRKKGRKKIFPHIAKCLLGGENAELGTTLTLYSFKGG